MSLEETIAAIVKTAVAEALAADTRPGALTIEQAARYLQTSPPTIKALIAAGELPCLKNGRRTYVGRTVIDALLARGATVAANGETS